MAPLFCRASKASRFRLILEGAEVVVALVVITESLDSTLLLLPELCPEVWEVVRKEKSPWTEELPESDEVSELPRSREVCAWDGNFLMNFSGKKRERDLGFP